MACGGVGSHNGFRFQTEYFNVLKKVLPCVIWMVACKIKFLMLSKRCIYYFELMDYMQCLE